MRSHLSAAKSHRPDTRPAPVSSRVGPAEGRPGTACSSRGVRGQGRRGPLPWEPEAAPPRRPRCRGGLARPRIPAPGTSRLGTTAQQQPLTFSWVQAAAPRMTLWAAAGREASSSRWKAARTRRCPPPAISPRPSAVTVTSLGARVLRLSSPPPGGGLRPPLSHLLPVASPRRCAARSRSSPLATPTAPHPDLSNPRAGQFWKAGASKSQGDGCVLVLERTRRRRGGETGEACLSPPGPYLGRVRGARFHQTPGVIPPLFFPQFPTGHCPGCFSTCPFI